MPDKYYETRRKYRQDNPEKIRQWRRDYYKRSKDKVIAYSKMYYKKKQEEKLLKNGPPVKKETYGISTQRRTKIKNTYGLTLEVYNLIKKRQNNSCAICEKILVKDSDFCIDHEHSSNFIRGLLCSSCNKILGFCYENPKILKKAINYLNRNQKIHASRQNAGKTNTKSSDSRGADNEKVFTSRP